MSGLASWEASSNKKQKISETRDCQSIAGFLFYRANKLGSKRKETMNPNKTKVPTRFGPETRFSVTPVSNIPLWVTREAKFDWLKERLLRERLEQMDDPGANNQIRRAANEATALALGTCYPLLVFPNLFEEKVETALACVSRRSSDELGPQLVPA